MPWLQYQLGCRTTSRILPVHRKDARDTSAPNNISMTFNNNVIFTRQTIPASCWSRPRYLVWRIGEGVIWTELFWPFRRSAEELRHRPRVKARCYSTNLQRLRNIDIMLQRRKLRCTDMLISALIVLGASNAQNI